MVPRQILRIVILGVLGRQGRRRLQAVLRVSGLKLVSVVDAPARAAELSHLASQSDCYASTDWKSEVARSDVEVVILCLPNHLHTEIATTALAHGKHVLVEKPLANTVEDAEKIVAAGEAAGRVVKTGFNFRHREPVELALCHLRDGRIGALHTIRATIGHSQFLDSERRGTWFTDPALGGRGAMLDLGIHLLDAARAALAIFGDEFEWVTAATAGGRIIQPDALAGAGAGSQIEQEGAAVFRTRNGHLCVLHASWVETRKFAGTRLEFFGEHGRVEADLATRTTRLTRRVHGQLLEAVTTFEFQDPDPSWAAELANLRDAILDGRRPDGDGLDGLEAQRLVFAAYASADSGRPVCVTDRSAAHANGLPRRSANGDATIGAEEGVQ